MRNASFRRTLVGAAVAAALGVVGPADAGPYRGTFDPVDFAGEYVINVDAACIAQANGWYANSGICTATLTSAFATVASSAPQGPNFTGTMIFAPPFVSDPFELFGVYVYGGKLDSIDSDLIHQASPAAPGGVSDWWLQFVSGHCPSGSCYGNINIDVATDVGPEGVGPLGRGVYLFAGNPVNPIASAQFIGPAVAIPEPGTLSLLLGALGGGWLARRRRKEKVPDPN